MDEVRLMHSSSRAEQRPSQQAQRRTRHQSDSNIPRSLIDVFWGGLTRAHGHFGIYASDPPPEHGRSPIKQLVGLWPEDALLGRRRGRRKGPSRPRNLRPKHQSDAALDRQPHKIPRQTVSARALILICLWHRYTCASSSRGVGGAGAGMIPGVFARKQGAPPTTVAASPARANWLLRPGSLLIPLAR